ncbi:oligomeric golgi complex component, COG2-domain-containing protein [Sphaerosporella brunnea]|uniref:Conserved oligomeric Golgi complex subunit 2 n=1 Tax=Sphaerosporella brunnea TaxID=1250544 RepID=A0A5J5EKF7_9PEZI|nr:oligomeric golgi complex component, COG2-domain-containing protein [Sphaerosporella brunnea]
MSFQLGAPSDHSSDDEDLPFPAPLAHDAFQPTGSEFSPHTFLSSLRNRHQTLEDLRSELRNRSKDLESELVELVNRDYADFVGLGSSVKGGEGRVEDLKVGLLEFRREVETIVRAIEEVKTQVEAEIRAKERIRKEKALGRPLLALAQKLDELSVVLLLDGSDSVGGPPGFLEDGDGLTSSRRLGKLVRIWVYVVDFLLPKVPTEHPFVKRQGERMKKIRETLLIDLKSALKESRRKGEADTTLELLGMFADLRAEGEAVKAVARK